MQFVKKSVGGIVALALCAVMQSHAQGNFGGGAVFNGGGAQNRAQSSSSSQTYNPAGTVGNAQISIDPDTHRTVFGVEEDIQRPAGNKKCTIL